MRLQGKTALVTGAGRGIGRAVALRLAREGADVTVNDIVGADIEAVAGEIEALGRRALRAEADVSRPSAVDALVAEHQSAFGGLDILVNNAGVIVVKPLWELTEEDWDRLFAVNVKSIFFCSRAAARLMIPRGAGKIINTASAASYRSSPLQAGYCASKHAVKSLTHSLAKELAPHNIQVNAVCPGIIDTDMWDLVDTSIGALQGLSEPREFTATLLAQQVAARRIGTPGEVAALFAFLASPDSDYVTGQLYGVDGGLVYN